jgi:hypothetical protein
MSEYARDTAMTKAIALPIESLDDATITVDRRLVARGDKTSAKHAWARALIRKAIEALRREGVPLDDLTNGQIIARCSRWMRRQGMLDNEIPRPRSFERHLPKILAEVLVSSSIG